MSADKGVPGTKVDATAWKQLSSPAGRELVKVMATQSAQTICVLSQSDKLHAGHGNYLERLAAYADAEREWEDLRLCCLSLAGSLFKSSAAILGRQPCNHGWRSMSAAVALFSGPYSNMGSRKLLSPCACTPSQAPATCGFLLCAACTFPATMQGGQDLHVTVHLLTKVTILALQAESHQSCCDRMQHGSSADK